MPGFQDLQVGGGRGAGEELHETGVSNFLERGAEYSKT